MAASIEAAPRGTDASSGHLNFDVIDARVADILDIPIESVGDAAIGELLGFDRSTIWRWREKKFKPSLPLALAMASTLGLTVAEITAPKAGA